MTALPAALSLLPTITLAELDAPTENVHQKLRHGAQAGFFYVELTEDWKDALEAGKQFSKTFSTGPEAFRDHYAFKYAIDGGFSVPVGYAPVSGFQCESFRLISKDLWNNYLTPEVVQLANRMTDIAAKVIQLTLKSLHVKDEMWDKILGGNVGSELVTLTFNRYTSQRAGEGLPAHQDSGLITVLYNDQPGLQGRIGNANEWSSIDPKKNHLIINFGRSLEFSFKNDPGRKLVAIEHRVPRLEQDRISIAVFFDRSSSSSVYQMSEEKCTPVESKEHPGVIMTYAEYLKMAVEKFDAQSREATK